MPDGSYGTIKLVIGGSAEGMGHCNGRPPRLLARFTHEGVAVWCKDCKQEHVFRWETLDPIRRSLAASGPGHPSDPI